VNQNILKFILL